MRNQFLLFPVLEIISGRKLGRESKDERIVFTHKGMGASDITTAFRIYAKAAERGAGTKVRLF